MSESWREMTLGALCDAGMGMIKTGPFGAQLHESDYVKEGVPVVMPKDIHEGRVSTRTIARVSEKMAAQLEQHVLKPGDIVYGRRGDIGRQALITDREHGWLCGTGCLRVTLGRSKALNPTFLHYYLRDLGVISWISNQAIGATMPNLNTSILRSVPIHFPPFPIQHKIAGVLSAYDDLIENNTRRIALLEEMAQALYREWFVEFRFPGHETAEFVEDEQGRRPGKWARATVGDVAPFISRGIAPKYDEASPSLVINQKCIRSQRLSFLAARRHLSKVPLLKQVRFGDVLINSTGVGTLGRVAQVCEKLIDCTVDSHVTIVRPDLLKVDLDFFGLALLSKEAYFEGLGVGATGQTELGRERVGGTSFLLPELAVQSDFGGRVRPLREAVLTLERRNVNLRRTRDLLLPRLISGELDVGDLDVRLSGEATSSSYVAEDDQLEQATA